jgi:hypothetical protein
MGVYIYIFIKIIIQKHKQNKTKNNGAVHHHPSITHVSRLTPFPADEVASASKFLALSREGDEVIASDDERDRDADGAASPLCKLELRRARRSAGSEIDSSRHSSITVTPAVLGCATTVGDGDIVAAVSDTDEAAGGVPAKPVDAADGRSPGSVSNEATAHAARMVITSRIIGLGTPRARAQRSAFTSAHSAVAIGGCRGACESMRVKSAPACRVHSDSSARIRCGCGCAEGKEKKERKKNAHQQRRKKKKKKKKKKTSTSFDTTNNTIVFIMGFCEIKSTNQPVPGRPATPALGHDNQMPSLDDARAHAKHAGTAREVRLAVRLE